MTSVTTRVSAAASTALAALLAGPAQPAKPLASFPVATYLDTPGGVVALVTPDAVRLPNAVLINPAGYEAVSASGPRPLLVGDGVVRRGDVEVAVARWWDPVPRLGLVDPAILRERLSRLRVLLPPWPSADDPAADRLSAGRALLVDALAGRVPPDRVAAALVGLGSGLTPAGDDLLAGAVAGLAIFGRAVGDARPSTLAGAASSIPAGVAAGLADAVARRAATTTPLAADLTGHAIAGAVAEPVAAVCRALAGTGALEPVVTRLLAVGHTSGRDLAEGLLVGGLAVIGRYRG